MYGTHTKRGSALMLTVGLLAILVLLGTAFLLVSHLNAKTSHAVVTRNQSMQVASGVAARVGEMLQADLHVGNSGPFSDGMLWNDAGAVLAYADLPRANSDPNDLWDKRARPDLYLAHPDNSLNIFSLLRPKEPNDPIDDLDINGSGDKNAWLRHSKAVSSTGEQYDVAVRVIDLSALACINTGCETAGDAQRYVDPWGPVLYDLRSLIGVDAYLDVRSGRSGGVDPTPQQYSINGASRLLNPLDSQYQPFAISDEMYLRYLSDAALTETGRLYQVIQDHNISEDDRSLLTTFSCSRQLLRWPSARGEKKLCIAPGALNLSVGANRVELYNRLYRLMYQHTRYGKDRDQCKRMAASFVANLWAYGDTDNSDAPWAVSLAGVTTWGLKQRLVITEAYAAHTPETVPGTSDDYIAGFAIEVFNPTDSTIELSEYSIKVGSDSASLPSGQVNPGGKAVLYSFEEGGNYTGNDNDRENDTGLKPGTGWYEINNPKIRFDDGDLQPVQLFLGNVIVDQVSGEDDEFEYAGTDIRSDGAAKADARRDDSLDRARYNLAIYKGFDSHKLGEDNELTSADFKDTALNSLPILDANDVVEGGMKSIAELANIYLTGPQKDGSDHTPFSYQILKENTEAVDFLDIPGRGRPGFYPPAIDMAPPTYPYPKVPLGCLMAEFLSMNDGDPTRPDDLRRMYGMVNINTAPKRVLVNLPWPESVSFRGSTISIDRAEVAQELIDYRNVDTTKWNEYLQYLPALRENQIYPGFLTPGEAAVPLAHYMCKQLNWTPGTGDPGSDQSLRETLQHPDFIKARDALYRSIADVITVRSDTFAAIIHVQVGKEASPSNAWKYLAVIDRSNCNDTDDRPAVLLFTPLK